MKKLLLSLVLFFVSFCAFAALTPIQQTTLIAALKISTDPTLAPLVTARDNVLIADWLNTASTDDAWHEGIVARSLFQASDITKFDGLTGGKRDAWRLMLDFTPHDMRINANRKAVLDVWGATDAPAVLTKCLRKATRGEVILGGTTKTTGTISGLDLNFVGFISVDDVSKAFINNP